MAKYPVRITFSDGPKAAKPKPMAKPAQNRAAPPITQARLDSHARRQAEEARSEAMLMRRKPAKDTISVVTRMRETPAKKK
jgi:hypothetical protein